MFHVRNRSVWPHGDIVQVKFNISSLDSPQRVDAQSEWLLAGIINVHGVEWDLQEVEELRHCYDDGLPACILFLPAVSGGQDCAELFVDLTCAQVSKKKKKKKKLKLI
jgi:hypothetical protein